MYELLEAIVLHNELLQEEYPECYEQDRVIIDVITGASAGAITAAILSQQLYCGGDRLRDPYDNPLFRVPRNIAITQTALRSHNFILYRCRSRADSKS